MKTPRFYRRFDYDRALLPNPYLRELEEGVANTDEAEKRTGWTIGYPGWGLIYQMLLNHFEWDKSNNVIETGTNWGCSTIVLAQAVKDSRGGGHVHSIEIEREFVDKADDNLRAAGLRDLVTLHHGNSLEQLPKILAGLDGVRAAFLDGAHQHDTVVAEFEMVLKKLAPTGIVLFDNTFSLFEDEPDQRVWRALQTIKSRHGGNVVNFEFTSWYTPGLAVWQR